MFEAIGPVWDGNEMWLVIAVAARRSPPSPPGTRRCSRGSTSPFFSILVLLIVRVVSFEWREKEYGGRWRTTWLWANTIGSLGAPFIWGVALANLLTACRSTLRTPLPATSWIFSVPTPCSPVSPS